MNDIFDYDLAKIAAIERLARCRHHVLPWDFGHHFDGPTARALQLRWNAKIAAAKDTKKD